MRTSRRLPISSVNKTLVFKNSPHHENECGEFFCIRRPLPADSCFFRLCWNYCLKRSVFVVLDSPHAACCFTSMGHSNRGGLLIVLYLWRSKCSNVSKQPKKTHAKFRKTAESSSIGAPDALLRAPRFVVRRPGQSCNLGQYLGGSSGGGSCEEPQRRQRGCSHTRYRRYAFRGS